jgi:hypothetical protein
VKPILSIFHMRKVKIGCDSRVRLNFPHIAN